jgi:hypothetical protein
MENGPDLWTKVLAQFPTGAIIAGGAVRDFLMGVPPKDIDVFLPASAVKNIPPTEGFDFAFVDPRFGFHRIDSPQLRISEYEGLNNISLVSRGEIEGYTVDLVEFTIDFTGQQLVETFDFWINWCWFDGEIHDTPEARNDQFNNEVTLCNEERLERSLVRFERFNARHNGAYMLCRP